MSPADEQSVNPTRLDYNHDILGACHRALATIVKAIDGQQFPRLVLIGGLAPTLLLDSEHIDALFREELHPGTNDIDLCVQVELTNDDTLYASLLGNLKALGFEPRKRNDGVGESTWQWVRTVDGTKIAMEFLAPADGVTSIGGAPAAGRIGEESPNRPGDEIGAFRLPAGQLALEDIQQRTLEVDLLGPPDEISAGRARVQVWVANILPLLVLKSLALRNRQKNKDAFDIVWLLTRWPGGPRAVARDSTQSPVANNPFVGEALAILEGAFADPAQYGCRGYAIFELGGKVAMQSPTDTMQLALYARGAVQEFLTAWRAHQR